MKFKTAKILTLGLFLAALAIGVGAILLTEEGSTAYSFSLGVVLALFAAGLLTALLWGRCPHCGKRIFVNFLRLSKCPACQKSLDADARYDKKRTGAKRPRG